MNLPALLEMYEETVRKCVAIGNIYHGQSDLVHARFKYRCNDCTAVEYVYVGVGVEGPDRSHGLYIASPFSMECPVCYGTAMTHVDWPTDQHFPPVNPPPGVRYFAIPDGGPNPERFNTSMFSGEMRRAK